MYYILITDNKARQNIPENDPRFPGIPIEDRYAPDILAKCVQSETEVPEGWLYDADSGTFSEPPVPEVVEPEPEPEPPQDPDTILPSILTALSEACRAAIVDGCDVTLFDGSAEHFALEETDQINIATALQAVKDGAPGFPYHADGDLCKLYPAADIIAISNAAAGHKLYHTTYHNHLSVWAKRAATVEELEGITYGAQLPPDLESNMEAILHAAGL